jgi:hypothetical protein
MSVMSLFSWKMMVGEGGGDATTNNPEVERFVALAERLSYCTSEDRTFCVAALRETLEVGRVKVSPGEIICDVSAFIRGGKFYLASLRKAIEVSVLAANMLWDEVEKDHQSLGRREIQVRFLGVAALVESRGLVAAKGQGMMFWKAVQGYVHAQCLRTSTLVARAFGVVDEYAANEAEVLRSIGRARDAVAALQHHEIPQELRDELKRMWDTAFEEVLGFGLRNYFVLSDEENVDDVTQQNVGGQGEDNKGEQVAIRHVFSLQGITVSVIVVLDDQGSPLEFILSSSQRDSLTDGLLGTIGQLITRLMKAGVPLTEVVGLLQGTCFLPFGEIKAHPSISFASSIMDYLAQWINRRFVSHNSSK